MPLALKNLMSLIGSVHIFGQQQAPTTTQEEFTVPSLHDKIYRGVTAVRDRPSGKNTIFRELEICPTEGFGLILPHRHRRIWEHFHIEECEHPGIRLITTEARTFKSRFWSENSLKFTTLQVSRGQTMTAPPGNIHGFIVPQGGVLRLAITVKNFTSGDAEEVPGFEFDISSN